MRPFFSALGYEVIRRPQDPPPAPPDPPPAPLDPLVSLLNSHRVGTVVDVGANVGQFGLKLRKAGFDGLIISIEPLSSAFGRLQSTASANGPWEVIRSAAGDRNGEIEINIAGNSDSSSVLPMAKCHEDAAPTSRYVGTETVPACTLDTLLGGRINEMGRFLLKLDVQGYEDRVLAGAAETLSSATGLLMETSTVPLYEGSLCIQEVLPAITKQGFTLQHVERAFWDDKTLRLLQLDCLFFRDTALQSIGADC